MAEREDRILLPMDLGFGALLAVTNAQLPSGIVFRLSDERSEYVNDRLGEAPDRCATALEAGGLVSVGDTAIRIRRLPI